MTSSLRTPALWRSLIRSTSPTTRGVKRQIGGRGRCLGPNSISRSLFYSHSARWWGTGGTRPQPFSALGATTATRRSISACFGHRAVGSRDGFRRSVVSRSASSLGYSGLVRWCHTRQNSGLAIGAGVKRRWIALSPPRTAYAASCPTRRTLSSLGPRSGIRAALRSSGRWEVLRQRRWASQSSYRTVQQQKARYRSGVCILLAFGVCSVYFALVFYLLGLSLNATIQSPTAMRFLIDPPLLRSYMLEYLQCSLYQSSTIMLFLVIPSLALYPLECPQCNNSFPSWTTR